MQAELIFYVYNYYIIKQKGESFHGKTNYEINGW